MWVVKLGGAMSTDPMLPQWLDLVARLGRGRMVVVAGGGPCADAVRQLQALWQFDDLTAHNMAVLAMAQTAHMLRGLEPELAVTTDEAHIKRILRRGQSVLWHPLALQRDAPDRTTNWSHTSDSIALELAQRLNAERLLLIKRCDIQTPSLANLSRDGVIDGAFPSLASKAPFPIDVLSSDQLAAVRDMLLSGNGLP